MKNNHSENTYYIIGNNRGRSFLRDKKANNFMFFLGNICVIILLFKSDLFITGGIYMGESTNSRRNSVANDVKEKLKVE